MSDACARGGRRRHASGLALLCAKPAPMGRRRDLLIELVNDEPAHRVDEKDAVIDDGIGGHKRHAPSLRPSSTYPQLSTGRRAGEHAEPVTTKHTTTSAGNTDSLALRAALGRSLMLMAQLIGAAFLLLCVAPLLARDPGARRSSR